MNMNGDFWSMGGYGAYVWGSFGAALLVFAWNVAAPWLERRRVLKRLRENADSNGAGQ